MDTHNYRKDGKPFPIRIILAAVINHSGDTLPEFRTEAIRQGG